MKKIYVCAVRLAIEADNSSLAKDGVWALLSEQAKKYVPTSCLLDWEYDSYGAPHPQLVHDNFGFDGGVPQIYGRVVSL